MKLNDKIRNRLKKVAIGTAIVASVAFPCIAKAEQPLNIEFGNQNITQAYKAKHIYKDPLFKLASDKARDKIIDAQKNMKVISDITNQIYKAAGVQEDANICWTDNDEDERKEFGEIGFAMSQSLTDSDYNALYANSESASILSKDEIACVISHEVGHLVGNSLKVHQSVGEMTNIGVLSGSKCLQGMIILRCGYLLKKQWQIKLL